MMDSPDVGNRKMNNKVGVQLAPLQQQASNMPGQGRASMMSIKGMEHEQEGTDSHPILRVHNYKKPTLEKLRPQGMQKNDNINFTVDDMAPQYQQQINNGKIQMTFQATLSIDQNQHQNQGMVLNSKKMHGARKRDNAVLAPLNHPANMTGNTS